MEEEALLCQECKTNPSKYKCPGCSFRSCSLSCVKAHKLRHGCTGKRTRTQFVPLCEFDDNRLLSDYNLLEEVKRISESAQRLRKKLCPHPPPIHHKLPFPLQSLRKAAAKSRTKVLFLSTGMAKRELNKTRYDQRKKSIVWTIEWQFHSTDTVIVDHGVNDNRTLSSVIEQHLKPGPWKHQLSKFCEEQLDSLKFYVRKFPKEKSAFRELDIKSPIWQQFSDLVILEYPIIYVFLPSHSLDFKIVKDSYPVIGNRPELKKTESNDHMMPEAVAFKEEEIEEDNNSLDTQVFDLKKHMNLSPQKKVPCQTKTNDEVMNNSSDVSREIVAGNGSHSAQMNSGQGIFDDLEFDFDQGLIDTYSDLIAQLNPDEFLDLESIFAKEVEVEEELEEGEILD